MEISERNLRLKAAIVNFSPYTHVKTSDSESAYNGFMFDLISFAAKWKNLSLEFVTPIEGGWGKLDAYGQWTGMMGLVHKNLSNIVLTPFYPTEDRMPVLIYSPTVDYMKSSIFTGIPESHGHGNVDVGDTDLKIFIPIAICFFSIYGLGWLSHRIDLRESTKSGITLWNVIELLLLKGRPPRNLSHNERILYVVWSCIFFFLLTVMSSSLIALLSVRPVLGYIREANDIFDFPDVIPVVPIYSKEQDLLKDSGDLALQEISRRIEDNPVASQIRSEDYYNESLLRSVQKGEKCFLSMSETTVYDILNYRLPCRRSSFAISKPYREKQLVIGFAKKMPILIRKAISLIVLRFFETRQIKKYENAIAQNSSMCVHIEGQKSYHSSRIANEVASISLEQLEVAFFVVLSLSVFAGTFGMFELCFGFRDLRKLKIKRLAFRVEL